MKEKDKLWTINHSSEIILRMIDFIWSFSKSIDPLYTPNLFAKCSLMGVQESVGLFLCLHNLQVLVHIPV